jgi:GT2 family glycosyltransferase
LNVSTWTIMITSPAASLIIINYNGADLLPDCIESVLPTLRAQDELLVVDNASTDTSLAVLARFADVIRIVPLPRNIGFGRACNLGSAAARGDLLVFLNPDVTFPHNWRAPLVHAAWSDPRIALLCPQTLLPGSPDPCTSGSEVEEHATVPGCCLAVRRDAWLALGGFDEAFFLYWEDIELCWRAWLLGWRVVTARRSWVYHQKSAITARRGGWDAERMRNSMYTYLKLMRWPVVLQYMMRLLVITAIKSLRDPSLAPHLALAWWWNIAHLKRTLLLRHAIAARRIGSYSRLEHMIRTQNDEIRQQRRSHHT